MNTAISGTIDARVARPRALMPVRAAIALGGGVIGALAWRVADRTLYTSDSSFGYALGVTGGSMMLLLLLYPLRKHAVFMRDWLPLRYWFRMHMICGIAGPVCILFHTTFRLGSLNATVALSCTLLVAASGVIGRFLYRRIHHGLYGSRATLAELEQLLARSLGELEPLLRPMPPIRDEVSRFGEYAGAHPASWGRRGAHFLSLGWQRFRANLRVRRIVAQALRGPAPALARQQLGSLQQTVAATLLAMQRAAQFSTYERLFSLWHVLHVPFVYMLVVTAFVHVVAVHAY